MKNSTTSSHHSDTNDRRAGKYLTFILAGEEYGIEILKVREIIGMMDITPVPRMPDYVDGVINLRGKVIPVIDLRSKFDMDRTQKTPESCIIVVEATGSQIGCAVDKVSEVLDIVGQDIEDAPSVGAAADNGFILGMGKAKGKVKILLNIDRVLTQTESSSLQTGLTEIAA